MGRVGVRGGADGWQRRGGGCAPSVGDDAVDTGPDPGREGSRMSTVERRTAARANQRAAAFVRFQMLGDHEAMHFILTDSGESHTARLAFLTALASIAGTV